jgi:hypothetical protein
MKLENFPSILNVFINILILLYFIINNIIPFIFTLTIRFLFRLSWMILIITKIIFKQVKKYKQIKKSDNKDYLIKIIHIMLLI